MLCQRGSPWSCSEGSYDLWSFGQDGGLENNDGELRPWGLKGTTTLGSSVPGRNKLGNIF